MAKNADMTMTWGDIKNAPKDGRPLWVKGRDYGKKDGAEHCCWAWFDGSAWRSADMPQASTLEHLTHYLRRVPPHANPKQAQHDAKQVGQIILTVMKRAGLVHPEPPANCNDEFERIAALILRYVQGRASLEEMKGLDNATS